MHVETADIWSTEFFFSGAEHSSRPKPALFFCSALKIVRCFDYLLHFSGACLPFAFFFFFPVSFVLFSAKFAFEPCLICSQTKNLCTLTL